MNGTIEFNCREDLAEFLTCLERAHCTTAFRAEIHRDGTATLHFIG